MDNLAKGVNVHACYSEFKCIDFNKANAINFSCIYYPWKNPPTRQPSQDLCELFLVNMHRRIDSATETGKLPSVM